MISVLFAISSKLKATSLSNIAVTRVKVALTADNTAAFFSASVAVALIP